MLEARVVTQAGHRPLSHTLRERYNVSTIISFVLGLGLGLGLVQFPVYCVILGRSAAHDHVADIETVASVGADCSAVYM